MISCDTSKLEAQLKEFHKEAIRKMEGMVETFTYWIVWKAIETTPFGDSEEYFSLYNHPMRVKSIRGGNNRAGLAKGGWVVEMNKPHSFWWFMQAENENAESVKNANDARTEHYKLGDTVYIANNVPYVSMDGWPYATYKNGQPVMSLESGASQQAPQGIMQPTLNEIMNVYQLKLNEFYEAS
jgi:hypothetical protein